MFINTLISYMISLIKTSILSVQRCQLEFQNLKVYEGHMQLNHNQYLKLSTRLNRIKMYFYDRLLEQKTELPWSHAMHQFSRFVT